MKKTFILFFSLVMSLNIKAQVPVPAIDSYVYSSSNPICTFIFSDVSTNNPYYSEWDFGDGSPYSNQQSTQHVYTNYGVYHLILTSCNANGCDTTSCNIVSDASGCHACSTLTDINLLPIKNSNFTISPNPFSLSTQISFDKTYPSIALSLYDLQGKLLLQNHYTDCNQITLQRNQLSTGLYFLKLIIDDKQIETRKIVIGD